MRIRPVCPRYAECRDVCGTIDRGPRQAPQLRLLGWRLLRSATRGATKQKHCSSALCFAKRWPSAERWVFVPISTQGSAYGAPPLGYHHACRTRRGTLVCRWLSAECRMPSACVCLWLLANRQLPIAHSNGLHPGGHGREIRERTGFFPIREATRKLD